MGDKMDEKCSMHGWKRSEHMALVEKLEETPRSSRG
jgi:hypothetical protein